MLRSLVLVAILAAAARAGVSGTRLREEATALQTLRTKADPAVPAVVARIHETFNAVSKSTTRVDVPGWTTVSGTLARIAGCDEALRSEAILVMACADGDPAALAALPLVVRQLALRGKGPGRTVLVLASSAAKGVDPLETVAAAASQPIVAVIEIEALEATAGRPAVGCHSSPGLQRTLLKASRKADVLLWFVAGGRRREAPDPVENVRISPRRDHVWSRSGKPTDRSLGAMAEFTVEVARILADGEEQPPLGRAAPADDTSSAGLLKRAERLAAARRFTEALGLAARALDQESQSLDARLFRGRVLLELNRPEAARAEAEEALRARAEDPRGLLLRGRAAEAMGDEAGALGDYGSVLIRLPDSVEARARRGLLLVKRAQIKAGLEDLERALARSKDHPIALKGKGVAQFYARKFGQAARTFDRVVRLDQDDWESWFYRGLVRIFRDSARTGSPPSVSDYRLSISDFTKAITADPRVQLPFIYRGDVHIRLGEYDRARADYDRAIAIGPATADLHFQRGLARLSLDAFDTSIEDFRQVVALDPTMASAPYNIACAHARAGRPEEAMKWLGSAVAAGFLDAPGNLEHLRIDPDLKSLHERADFRRLLRANRAD